MKHQNQFLTALMATALMLSTSTEANAQLGGLLNKVKNKVTNSNSQKSNSSSSQHVTSSKDYDPAKEAAKREETIARMRKLREDQEKEKADREEAKRQAERAQLTDEQRWALDQLLNRSEEPMLPWPMVETQQNRLLEPERGLIPDDYQAFVKNIGNISCDSIQQLARQLNNRYAYNKRVLDGLKGVKDFTYYNTDAEDSKMRGQQEALRREIPRYEVFRSCYGGPLLRTFVLFYLVKNNDGIFVPTDNAKLQPNYVPEIMKTADGRWLFHKGKNTTWATPEQVEKCNEFIALAERLLMLQDTPDPKDRDINYFQLYYGIQVAREAIATNSRDNIVYRERPKGSALDTPAFRQQALNAARRGSPHSRIVDLIVTGDWVYERNVFGEVIRRYVVCAQICNTPVALEIIYGSVANERVGNGWGPLRDYGTGFSGGYVRE